MTRRERVWGYRLGAWFVGLLAWAALPLAAGADNCSSLTDCYGTVAAGLAATVGIALVLATVVSLPSILSSLEDLADRSLGQAAPGDEPATTAQTAADLTRAPEPPPASATTMARAPQPGTASALDSPGMPYEGSQASLRMGTVAAPGAGTPPSLPTAATHPTGGGADLPRGGGLGYPTPGGATGQDSTLAGSQQDLSRAVTSASTGGAESGRPLPLDDLSRTPSPAAGAASPAAATDLSRGAVGTAGTVPLSAGQSPGYPTPRLPMMNAPESNRPEAGLTQSLAASPPPGTAAAGGGTSQLLQGGEGPQQAGASQVLPPAEPSAAASAGGVLSRHGGGAESQAAQAAGSLGRADPAATGSAGANVLSRGGEGHVAGEPLRVPPTPTVTGAESAQPAPREAALSQGEGSSQQLGTAGQTESSRGLTGATSLGAGPGGADVGTAIASQVLARGESLDHVAQLDLALRGASTAMVDATSSAGLANALLHGLGLDAGVAVDTTNAILITSSDGRSMVRYWKATGGFDLLPLDPRVLALLPVGATIGFEPSRGRTAFGRYLRWAERGAPSEWLARDPDLAAIRAAGLTVIGQTRRATVARALGDPDQQWSTGNLLLAYRLPDWPGYAYIFEFDGTETLRSQGFVAEPRPAPAALLAVGMTRDTVWAQLGAPGASESWWPFERWRYRRTDGRTEVYEFAHGILRARFIR